jgi:hypothetical protein
MDRIKEVSGSVVLPHYQLRRGDSKIYGIHRDMWLTWLLQIENEPAPPGSG